LILMAGILQGKTIGSRNTRWEITREHLPRTITITGAKQGIEENIMKLQEKKRELADQILEGENLNGSSLTREELVELLTGK